MSKPTRRYQTAQAITRKIDERKAQIISLINEGAQQMAEHKRLLISENSDDKEACAFAKNKAEKLFKQAERIEKTAIPKLSEKLAVFNTLLLPGCGDDRSIPTR